MKEPHRQPGWDKQAINQIANEAYGGLSGLFEAHGWTTDGRVISQIAPTKVVQTYGSVDAFVRAHEDGRDGNLVLNPLAAIYADPPQVFLKSLYGFTPETWGFLGYTKETSRAKFLRDSKPGALLVICATALSADPKERLRVLGIQQQSHILGTKWDFLAPSRHKVETKDTDRRDKWLYALKALRAWRVAEDDRPFVRDIFPDTHSGGKKATAIGHYGLQVTAQEARRLLDLSIYEVPVFGGVQVDALIPGPAAVALAPSKPGPVSQSGHEVGEAEGPKHLYILHMKGEAEKLLGYHPNGADIVKIGFSVSPATRCDAHNRALPACAFEWAVQKSTADAKRKPFPSSKHALAGEQAMKDILVKRGKSLGGEFFLADQASVNAAWKAGIAAAEKFQG